MTRSRHRDRKGSLIIRGRERKFWLSQWPEGNKRRSNKLGWRDEMTKSQAELAHRQLMGKVNRHRFKAGDSVTLGGFFREHYWDEETKQYRVELSTKKPSTPQGHEEHDAAGFDPALGQTQHGLDQDRRGPVVYR